MKKIGAQQIFIEGMKVQKNINHFGSMVKGAVHLLDIRRILRYFECEDVRGLTTIFSVASSCAFRQLNYNGGFYL